MTAIAEAFQKRGLTAADAEFDVAIAKYINSGGTIERAKARVDMAAVRMSGMGKVTRAKDGQSRTAQTRHQVEGEKGHMVSVGFDHDRDAVLPSSNRGRDGHGKNAISGLFRIAVPAREPTTSQRSAALSAAKAASVTIMDTFKIDGLAIGQWSVARARVEATRKTRDGYILREALKVVANAAPHALLRNVVKIEEMQRIRQAAEEVADAV